MDTVISHTSALRLMRQPGFSADWREAPCAALPREMPSDNEILDLARRYPRVFDEGGRVEVLLAEKTLSHATQRVRPHVYASALPEGALIELAPGLRCVSPLLLAPTLSSKLDFLEMNLLLAELLGLYAINPENQMGLIQRAAPLIEKQGIEEFLANLGPAWGTRRTKEALTTAPILAASPQEARLYLRATLPCAKGGYNMGTVILNDAVELRRISQQAGSAQTRKPDLLFVGEKRGVSLDYMGAWHNEDYAVRHDAQRRNELLAAGFKPYEIFKRDYDNLDYMDALMQNIRDDLGMSPAKINKTRAERHRRARWELWRDLERIDVSFTHAR